MDSPGAVVLGCIAALVIMGGFAGAVAVFKLKFHASVAYVPVMHESEAEGASSTLHRTLEGLFRREAEWHARDPARDANLMRRFGMLFEGYREIAPWFLIAEVTFSVLVGVAEALIAITGCAAAAWLMAAFAVMFAAVIGLLRPHANRFDVEPTEARLVIDEGIDLLGSLGDLELLDGPIPARRTTVNEGLSMLQLHGLDDGYDGKILVDLEARLGQPTTRDDEPDRALRDVKTPDSLSDLLA